MKNFLSRALSGRFRKYSEDELMKWFTSNKKKIFCSGDVEIDENGVEWIYDKGNSSVKIKWREIKSIYVSSISGANNIYIESSDNRLINFYINNRDNCRDKFLKYLLEFATLKGAILEKK